MVEQYSADRRVVVERDPASAPGTLASAVIASARALDRLELADPSGWRVGAPPATPITLDQDVVTALLSEVYAARNNGIPEIAALSSGGLFLTLGDEQTPARNLHSLTFTLPAQAQDPDTAVTVLEEVYDAFGAFHGQVEDDRLLMLYQSQRAAQRAWDATPEEYRPYLPGPLPLADTPVPALLVPQEYDRRLVPSGVWWINRWDPEQVATVGRDRSLRAGWASAHGTASGPLTLLATREPLDVLNTSHAEHLRALIEALGLRELQHRFRYSNGRRRA
ncbi:hypothetical protein V7793_06265 [Streptomyces sp. KLMMK]|uniref:hypothetical protein n=1 Tax=Streptomyces sp. KLMMK TaxID=3109353 RepID=UPI003000F8C0